MSSVLGTRAACALCLVFAPVVLAAESRLYFEPQRVAAGDPGATITLSLDNEVPVYGFQLSLASEGPGIAFRGLDLEGTAAAAADWSGGSVLDDGARLTWGVVLNLGDPLLALEKVIPAGERHELARLEVEVPDAAGTVATVRFADSPDVGGAKNKLTTAQGDAIPVMAEPGTVAIDEPFLRGDANGDDSVDISDGIWTLNFLFLGTDPPVCVDGADANDGGQVDLADAIYIFGFLFQGGPAPPPPWPSPGLDPTPDELHCGP